MEATGERSINKRNIKNLSGEKMEPCAELKPEIIYNNNTIMSLFLRFMYSIDMKIKYT